MKKSTHNGCLGCVLLLRIPWDEKTPKDPAVKVVGDEFAPPFISFLEICLKHKWS